MKLLRLVVLMALSGLMVAAVTVTAASIATTVGAPVEVRFAEPPEPAVLAQRSRVFAADGGPIGVLYEENRRTTTIDQVPQLLIDAILAVEDEHFYLHDGIDLRATLRALARNIERGDVAQGGSTITQQLVKNAYLNGDQTVDRKIEEAVLAVQLEQQMTKDEILVRYLNTVYFGTGAHGVVAAAEVFFGKDDVADLTVAEAALLAGTIARPQSFNPFRDPERAAARRSVALDRMVVTGAITAEQAEQARSVPLPETPHDPNGEHARGYFLDEVVRLLMRDGRLGDTYAERFDAVFRGGLQIHTTLDRRMQAEAEWAVAANLPESPFTGSLISVEPGTGAVRAMVGGPGLDDLRFNLTTQGRRQSGSTFKIVVLAAALEAGHAPHDQVDASGPCEFEMPAGQDPWEVGNYGNARAGVVDLREAMVRSYNCAFARVAIDIGPERVAEMGARLGVRRSLPAVPSLALGTADVSPLEMASIAATLAAEGVWTEPHVIARVETFSGEVLFEAQPRQERVLDVETARSITEVLTDVITRGTGTAAAIGRPAAGKTGTTQRWSDAWFVGYVPHLATAVWMGSPEGQVPMENVAGRRVTGGSFPATIWGAYMREAVAPFSVHHFTPPDSSLWASPGSVGELPTSGSGGSGSSGSDRTSPRGQSDRPTDRDRGRPGR